jgi:hypothetical protein
VLVPVLDDVKHDYVGEEEIETLLADFRHREAMLDGDVDAYRRYGQDVAPSRT